MLDHSRVSPARPRPPQEPSVRDAGHLKVVRNRRLMKEYREITRSVARQAEPPFTVELVNDCLYEWNIHLFNIDRTSDLYRDMKDLHIRCIQLNMAFPENFPFSPPFLRVLAPRIERGFVMAGGAICMELLTPRGWASAYTVEAIIMQFAASLVKGQARVPGPEQDDRNPLNN
ncbi:ubiquitin-conjugating enzyme E2Q-like protein CG4502 [Pollicipes pollicipes]|uniref:ubiquitin-conjugating enzyme E2Q-like protein CG4502 n=1 Tax=Pollicipes pollicipes TaxID=41117 RepID=UPI001884E31F|nr:ubiquitin-conjugating enzyme E2Q-like protein CG4502 [Pollicipes pollicipes]